MKCKSFTVERKRDGDRPCAVITTESLDRDGDTIRASGWDLKSYRKNPVVLFGHDRLGLPIGRCTSVKRVERGLEAEWEWAPHAFAQDVARLWAGGFLNSTSVGFRPLEWERSSDESRPYGVDFLKQELLEFSVVPIPANSEALRRSVKALAERLPDTVSRSAGLELEDLFEPDPEEVQRRRYERDFVGDYGPQLDLSDPWAELFEVSG